MTDEYLEGIMNRDNPDKKNDNVSYPICPINLYFEGDEDKCDVTHCDFDTETRSCTEACKIEVKELQKEIDRIKPQPESKKEVGKLPKKNWWYQEDLIEKAISEKNCKELGLPISKHKHISVQDGEGLLVAYCGCHEKTLANARLIAAAPKMKLVIKSNTMYFQQLRTFFELHLDMDGAVKIVHALDSIIKENEEVLTKTEIEGEE